MTNSFSSFFAASASVTKRAMESLLTVRFFTFVSDVKKPSPTMTASIFEALSGSLMIFETETNPALHAERATRRSFAPCARPLLSISSWLSSRRRWNDAGSRNALP